MKQYVIQYRHKGKWLNFYTAAKSIEAAEAVALRKGIRGEGFEVAEVIDG